MCDCFCIGNCLAFWLVQNQRDSRCIPKISLSLQLSIHRLCIRPKRCPSNRMGGSRPCSLISRLLRHRTWLIGVSISAMMGMVPRNCGGRNLSLHDFRVG
ncbi:hypothetical protein BDZ89DRAFT_421475 [Hymenopellis radicata]|nr:hypothetical protein BDZ89DRAFT_421475 [Hymenopellis radicata]